MKNVGYCPKKYTLKDGRSGTFSVGCITIWAKGAFPTKYVWERSPMTDSKADSAHCKHLKPTSYRKKEKEERDYTTNEHIAIIKKVITLRNVSSDP